jgi:CO/xanthine dehydrogenase FAD-binding subunit
MCHAARVVYGGVSKKTFIASRTQDILSGSRINSNTLQRALKALELDLAQAGVSEGYGSVAYRRSVMQTCLYRALLRCYSRYAALLPSSHGYMNVQELLMH